MRTIRHLTLQVCRGVNFSSTMIDLTKRLEQLGVAIRTDFGDHPVQRCRLHKERNVLEYLPDELKDSARECLEETDHLDGYENET